MKYSLCELFLV